MSKRMLSFLIVATIILLYFGYYFFYIKAGSGTNYFRDDFKRNSVLDEADSMENSQDPNWWLDSGGVFSTKNGIGSTNLGDIDENSQWLNLYKSTNPTDTDDGYHPQNIFRLVTKSSWDNSRQEVFFRIKNINASKSPDRNESNGIFLFNRYQGAENLYYSGIRVDGMVVIKKKSGGNYYTMAQAPFIAGEYNKEENPNLLPIEEWIGLRSEVVTKEDGKLNIKLYAKKPQNNWKLVLEADDDGSVFEGTNIIPNGHGGIRTDFMDVEFSQYRIEKI